MSYAERTTRPPRTLTDREVNKLLKVTGQNVAGFRDHMIISLALGCALRESEIVALDVHDVADARGLEPKRTIQLRVFKRAGSGIGTDPKFQRVHLPDATFYKLKKYLKSEWHDRRPSAGTPLFAARTGHRLSTRRLRGMFQEWQRAAGFDHHYPFHTLRHTAISNVRRRTKDIRIAQIVARHVNIATTTRYEHASDEEVAAAVRGALA